MRFFGLALIVAFLFADAAFADDDTKELVASVKSLTTAVEKRDAEWWKPLLGPVAGGLVGFGTSMLTLLVVYFRSRWGRPVLEGIVDATKGGLVTVGRILGLFLFLLAVAVLGPLVKEIVKDRFIGYTYCEVQPTSPDCK